MLGVLFTALIYRQKRRSFTDNASAILTSNWKAKLSSKGMSVKPRANRWTSKQGSWRYCVQEGDKARGKKFNDNYIFRYIRGTYLRYGSRTDCLRLKRKRTTHA